MRANSAVLSKVASSSPRTMTCCLPTPSLSRLKVKKTRSERQQELRPPWMRGKKPKFHNGFRARSLFPILCPLSLSLSLRRKEQEIGKWGDHILLSLAVSLFIPPSTFLFCRQHTKRRQKWLLTCIRLPSSLLHSISNVKEVQKASGQNKKRAFSLPTNFFSGGRIACAAVPNMRSEKRDVGEMMSLSLSFFPRDNKGETLRPVMLPQRPFSTSMLCTNARERKREKYF